MNKKKEPWRKLLYPDPETYYTHGEKHGETKMQNFNKSDLWIWKCILFAFRVHYKSFTHARHSVSVKDEMHTHCTRIRFFLHSFQVSPTHFSHDAAHSICKSFCVYVYQVLRCKVNSNIITCKVLENTLQFT